jgi:hypothetical protein
MLKSIDERIIPEFPLGILEGWFFKRGYRAQLYGFYLKIIILVFPHAFHFFFFGFSRIGNFIFPGLINYR